MYFKDTDSVFILRNEYRKSTLVHGLLVYRLLVDCDRYDWRYTSFDK